MKKAQYIVIYTNFPNLSVAKRIVSGLVERNLIACGNLFRVSSIYRWKGEIEESQEYGALIKTTRSKYPAVEQYIKDEHPYDVPEIICWDIAAGQREFLAWIGDVTG